MKNSQAVTDARQGVQPRTRRHGLHSSAGRDNAMIFTAANMLALQHLLGDGRVSIAFQPIWDIAQGRVLAFEALARPDADYGFAGPQEMFDLAQCLGQVRELDAICVRSVLARAVELPGDTLLFMNVTPGSLTCADYFSSVALPEAVASAGLPPSRIVLEITERSDVAPKEIVQQVKCLRQAGFQIALDDIGAAQSGPQMLGRIPADFVKIDRSVVKRALTRRAAFNTLVALTALAREAGMEVIVEGIERLEMLALVQQIKGLYGQGYILGRPSEMIPDASILGDAILISPV